MGVLLSVRTFTCRRNALDMVVTRFLRVIEDEWKGAHVFLARSLPSSALVVSHAFFSLPDSS